MKMKLFCHYIGILLLSQTGVGCASQLPQIAQLNDKEENTNTSPLTTLPTDSARGFVSETQEIMYEVMIAEIAEKRGNYPLAAETFLKLAKQLQDVTLAKRATYIANLSRNPQLAQQTAQYWLQLEPKSPAANQYLNKALLRQTSPEKALQQLENMLDKLSPDSPEAVETLITFLEQQQENTDNLPLIEKILTKRPQDTTVLYVYARLLFSHDQADRAIEILEQLLKLRPDHTQAIPFYATLLMQKEKTTESLQLMQEALKRQPENKIWQRHYARLLIASEKLAEAAQVFEKLLIDTPQDAEILYFLGILSLQLEKIDIAKNHFMNLLRTGEQTDIAHYFLGQIAELQNNDDDALFWYEKVKSGSNYLTAQGRYAYILSKKGNTDKALKHLQQLTTRTNEDKLIITQLEADLLIQQKRHNDVIATATRGLKLDPNQANLLYIRAMAAVELDKINEAEKDLRQILKIHPEHVEALNALGYTLANHTTRYEEAYDLIQQALSQRPEAFYILDSMGWVLYRKKQYVEALTYLRKAIEIKHDPEIAAHLGEVLWITGEKTEAKQVWTKALEAFAEDELLQQTVKRFVPELLN